MKYSVLLAAMLLSFNAFAAEPLNYAKIDYTFRDTIAGQSDNPNRQGVNFTFGHKVSPNLVLDVNQQFRTEKLNSDDGSSSTRLETGLLYTAPLNQTLFVYTRGALGYKFTSDDDSTYYSIEPGVKWKAFENLSLKAGYRYRTAFNDSIFDKTNTVRVGAEFDLDKQQSLSLGVDRAYGDSEYLGLNAGYQVKF